MSRYAWLLEEIRRVPRKKFHLVEPRSCSDLAETQARYGPLPLDYLEFVQQFGQTSFFRAPEAQWHYLSINAPPEVALVDPETKSGRGATVRLRVGHYINTGYAWFEWRDGLLLENASVFLGLHGQRRKGAATFEQWLRPKFEACKKFYSREEWRDILTPVPPFDLREQQIIEAMSKFLFRKVGVTLEGDILVEVQNQSPQSLRYLTVGVRDQCGMTGACFLPTSAVPAGTTRTIRQAMYKGAMDPHRIELFRLPPPDPEDRPYYGEFRSTNLES